MRKPMAEELRVPILEAQLKGRGEERRTDLGTLVCLEIDAEGGVAVLELHDPQRFNTMGWALGDDMTRSVNHLHQLGGVRAVTLQGAGSTFCAGGNQYNSSGLASLTASSQHLLKSIQVCLLTTCLVVMLLASSPRPHAVVGLCRCACFARAGRMRCARWHGRRRGRDLLAY